MSETIQIGIFTGNIIWKGWIGTYLSDTQRGSKWSRRCV